MKKRSMILGLSATLILLSVGCRTQSQAGLTTKNNLPIEQTVYSTFTGEHGVTVERIDEIPAPWDSLKDELDALNAPTGVYKTERIQDALYAYVLIQGGNNNTLTLQSPTIRLHKKTLYIQAKQVRLDPEIPMCCPALFAFKFKIPNVPQGNLKVVFKQ